MYVYVYIYIYIMHTSVSLSLYIYIYRERERFNPDFGSGRQRREFGWATLLVPSGRAWRCFAA